GAVGGAQDRLVLGDERLGVGPARNLVADDDLRSAVPMLAPGPARPAAARAGAGRRRARGARRARSGNTRPGPLVGHRRGRGGHWTCGSAPAGEESSWVVGRGGPVAVAPEPPRAPLRR